MIIIGYLMAVKLDAGAQCHIIVPEIIIKGCIMDDLELCYMPAVDMAVAISERKLSPVEVMDAILSRIDRLNPGINAYCTLAADDARQQAREAEDRLMKGEGVGRLHGIPVSIKDLIFTKGIRTTSGSRIFQDFIPEQDDIVVERLKQAGAIVIGKTNTPEFGHKGVTDNPLFGATSNPWNLEYTPGGSSGGAAAAVAAGMGPLAIGTDGGANLLFAAVDRSDARGCLRQAGHVASRVQHRQRHTNRKQVRCGARHISTQQFKAFGCR